MLEKIEYFPRIFHDWIILKIKIVLFSFGFKMSQSDFRQANLKSRSFLAERIANDGGIDSSKILQPIVAHMFWAYGELSKLEILCINSFIKNGYELFFWSYDEISNLPKGAILKDAREIIPEDRVFKYQCGSYAGLSNLFRYAVLCKCGGLWADADVICLLPMKELKNSGINGFLVTERTPDSLGLNCNVIYYPEHQKGSIIDLAFALTDRFDTGKVAWGDCGPVLLTMLAKTYPALTPVIMEPCFANPIDWWDCPHAILDSNGQYKLNNQWGFLHAFGSTWHKAGINKNINFPPRSLLFKIEKSF